MTVLDRRPGIESTGRTTSPVSTTTRYPSKRQLKVSHNKDENRQLPLRFNHTAHIPSLSSAFDNEFVSK